MKGLYGSKHIHTPVHMHRQVHVCLCTLLNLSFTVCNRFTLHLHYLLFSISRSCTLFHNSFYITIYSTLCVCHSLSLTSRSFMSFAFKTFNSVYSTNKWVCGRVGGQLNHWLSWQAGGVWVRANLACGWNVLVSKLAGRVVQYTVTLKGK